MFNYLHTFGGFSVNDLAKAKEFYGNVLRLKITEQPNMGITLHLHDDVQVFIYPKDNHQPATFTVLNFVVKDIDVAVKELSEKGVQFEHYQGMYQGEDGVARGLATGDGPNIAWFEDPAGNILSILQEK